MKKMNVLSIFGGIECGRVAMERLGWEIENYFSSEIDPYAIKVSSKNYPDIVHVGDIRDLHIYSGRIHNGKTQEVHNCYSEGIDILIGGSPCQDLSSAKGNGKGLQGEKSGLFYEYVRILKEAKPKYFLLENVASMKKADRDEITRIMGVEPVMINSSLVSAQNRKRLYWTNIPGMTQPADKGTVLADVLKDISLDDPRWKPLDMKYNDRIAGWSLNKTLRAYWHDERKSTLTEHLYYPTSSEKINSVTATTSPKIIVEREKSLAITATYGKKNTQNYFEKHEGQIVLSEKSVPVKEYMWRKLTPLECERLQTLPDGYTEGVSDSRRYHAIGNGWTVDVIAHILSFVPNEI